MGDEFTSWHILPKSQTSLRMGLLKSAFTPNIYRGLPIDFYLPLFSNTRQSLNILLAREPYTVKPKLYQIHDASLAHYQPLDVVLSSLRKVQNPSVWQQIMQQYVTSDKFMKLNRITQGSTELAALAAARFIHSLVQEIKKQLAKQETEAYRQNNQQLANAILQLEKLPAGQLLSMNAQKLQQLLAQQGYGNVAQQALQVLQNVAAAAVEKAAEDALRATQEYADLKNELESSASMLGGASGRGYAHDAISVIQFLRNPDMVRRRVRLVKLALHFFNRFMNLIPTSLQHQQTVSLFGGISGVDRMIRESQLKDILPTELAALAIQDEQLRKLLRLDFLLRLSQKQVMVYQRAATVKPVVFIDKSGSMVESMPGTDIPKISMAAGLALALHRKLDADIYLFDTEVEGPVPRSKIVDTLLKIMADGGTRIEEVLRKVLEIGRKDYVYIIISDGIDEVSSDIINELRKQGLLKNVRFIVVPPSWEASWLKNFRYVYARDVAQFEKGAVKVLQQ